jgi:predicted amidohydrolase YtcJ
MNLSHQPNAMKPLTIMTKHFLHSKIALLASFSLLGSACIPFSAHSMPLADIVYFNGQIETLNPKQARVSAVAIKDEKFIAVGSNQDMQSYIGDNTKTIDLQQQLTVPGLVDGHTHPMETIWLKEDWVDARFPNTPSVKQALQNIAKRVQITPKDQWVYVACVSASENKFIEKRLPTKAELDQIAPNNPVIVANGAHMAIANSAALLKMGVKKGVAKLPHGAGVLTDANGEPTGVITDGMGDIPGSPTPQEIARYYKSDIAKFWNSYGFTSLMAITPAAAMPVLQSVSLLTPSPNIRYTASVWAAPNGAGMPNDLHVFEMPAKANPDYYRFSAIKAWVDGENDCRTGFMYQPYVGVMDTDPPGGKGTLVTRQTEVNQFSKLANQNKKATMLHCSGDAAIDIGLNAYEQLMKSHPNQNIKRIEHFGMFQLTPEQLKRGRDLKKNNFHISVQPIWLLELVKADYENMGVERAKSGYQFKSMIDAGLEPAASTDMTGIYLGNIDPFKAMYATVTRQSDLGKFEPKQAISVRNALRMWTIWPAKAIGEEKVKGSIEVGKYGDMAVLSDDIFQIPKENIKDIKALKTIVGGRLVYEFQR